MPQDKFALRRAELAEATLNTLAALGYARTSLREIANNSEFSHGVLHYYFSDKVDLITCAVKFYKAQCVTRYDQATSTAHTPQDLIEKFVEKLGETLREESQMHRLWYDLRSQALFEAAFRKDVAEIDKGLEDMVWRIISRLADLSGMTPTLSRSAVYALFDGLFQSALLRYTSGDKSAITDLQDEARKVLRGNLFQQSVN